MHSKIAQLVSALLIFAIMDEIWFEWIAGWWYAMHIGPDNWASWSGDEPFGLSSMYIIWVRWGALVVSYALMALAVVYLALPFALLHHGGFFGRVDANHTPRQKAQYCKRREAQGKANFMTGATVGALIYGIYNFTNLSFLAEWDIQVALVDTAWGAFVFGVATAAVAAVGSAFDCLGECHHKVIREEIKIIDTQIEEDEYIADDDEIKVEEHIVEEVPVPVALLQNAVRPVQQYDVGPIQALPLSQTYTQPGIESFVEPYVQSTLAPMGTNEILLEEEMNVPLQQEYAQEYAQDYAQDYTTAYTYPAAAMGYPQEYLLPGSTFTPGVRSAKGSANAKSQRYMASAQRPTFRRTKNRAPVTNKGRNLVKRVVTRKVK